MTERANVLLILTDQHRADHVGYSSAGLVRTPSIDALASSGMVFHNAYSAASNCAPARGSLLTGLAPPRYPGHEGGIVTAGRALRPGFWTVAHALRSNDYQTAYAGKGHFRPIHADHGFSRMRMVEHLRAYKDASLDQPVDDWVRWLVWQGRAEASRSQLFGSNDPGESGNRAWTAVPFGHPSEYHPTSWVTDEAIRMLDEMVPDQPYFLVVSYPHPHPPLDPPEPYDTLYDPDSIELPAPYEPSEGTLPDLCVSMLERRGRQVPGHEDVARRALAYYRGLITQIDDAVGRLLEHVDLRDTVVCFTADHGDYGGHKNRMFKSPLIPFEDLAHVPMLWAGAGVEPGHCREVVQSSDFAPTVLELTAIDRPPYTDDLVSLAPVLAGGRAPADRIAATLDRSALMLGVRLGSLKLLHVGVTGEEILFDLAVDPEETTDVIDDPAHASAVAEMSAFVRTYVSKGIPDLPWFAS